MIKNDFYIVRHGESECNVLEIDCSKLENKNKFGLTEKGKKETENEAKKFNNFDLIFSSPFRRAKETADIFAKSSKCKVIENELLREVDVGDFELCNYKLSNSFDEKFVKGLTPYPNGESLSDAKKRAVEFFEQTNKKYKNNKILIVTHGWIVFCLLEHTLKDFDGEKYLREYDGARKIVIIGRF
jgi:broad specificity phosphatase PhoE